ncbi:MAG: CoA-binding protein [Microbacteriaceae bacterium]|nr:CoA-binding protein [Microbacteriaceae bacterium]
MAIQFANALGALPAEGEETVVLPSGITCAVPSGSALARTARKDRTWVGPSALERKAILDQARSIAVVGMSPDPSRGSYFVGTYLVQDSDYELFFVNPKAAGTQILGRDVHASLAELPSVPDVVVVFRRPDAIPSVVDEVVALGSPTIWVQLGIWNEEAARDAEAKGLRVVMDRCVKIEHARFHGGLHLLGFDTGVITARRRKDR